MAKKMLAACLAAAVLLTLTGFRLAREDAGESNNTDRLIGVFITREYLDLFDVEGYVKDNANKLSGGGEIMIDADVSRYQDRLYATPVTRTVTDEHTGNTYDMEELVFEGVEEIPYYITIAPDGEKENHFIMSCSDNAISDGITGYHVSDDEEKLTLEGTIYISPGRASKTLYINPVYQSDDGRIYAISGYGMLMSGDQREDHRCSRTLEETKTTTENGKSRQRSTTVKITMAIVFPPERTVVLQMDKDSAVLSQAEYTPGKLPDTLVPEENAEYIIVETHKRSPEGETVVSRSLYDKNNDHMETFYCRDDGICVKQWTKIEWNMDGFSFQ